MILNENFTITDLEKEYTEEEIDEACEALRHDYESDKHFINDFINFNNSEMLKRKIDEFLGKELTYDYVADMTQEEIEDLFDFCLWNMCEQIDMKFISEYLKYNFDYDSEEDLEEAMNPNSKKLYKAISDTADAIDNLYDDDIDSAKSNLNSAETNIVDVENELDKNESLTENLTPVPENYSINSLSPFDKAVKNLKLNEKDIDELKQELKKRPPKANIGNGVYKFEWWPKRFNLGKKEGRVIYIEYVQDSSVWLATMYQKNEKEDLTPQEKNDIINVANIIRGNKK